MLFKISGSSSCILGTLHFIPHGSDLAPSWKEAYRKTKALVVEAHLDEQPSTKRVYSETGSLRDELSESALIALSHTCNRLSLEEDVVLRMKPWAVQLELGVAMHKAQGRTAKGIDAILYRRAKAANRSIGTLETSSAGTDSLNSVD